MPQQPKDYPPETQAPKDTSGLRPGHTVPEDDDRCTAITRSGKNAGNRCVGWKVNGSQVCVFHGGNSRAAKAAAQRRFLFMVPMALRALAIAMEGAIEDRDWSSAVKAACALLDRGGFGPRSTVAVEEIPADLSGFSDAELRDELVKLTQIVDANLGTKITDTIPAVH